MQSNFKKNLNKLKEKINKFYYLYEYKKILEKKKKLLQKNKN